MTFIVWLGITVILVSGQCLQMRSVLIHLDLNRWVQILGMTSVVMLEATVPLTLLVACTWFFNRLREQNFDVVLAGAGLNLRAVLPMPLTFGLLISALIIPIATTLAPIFIDRIGHLTKEAALSAAVLSSQDSGRLQHVSRRTVIDDQSVDWFVGRETGRETAFLGRIEALATDWDETGPYLTFGRADYLGEQVQISVKSGIVRLDSGNFQDEIRVLTGPNSLVSDELDLGRLHHQFVYHRRLSMVGAIPAWVVLGTLLGLAMTRLIALSSATALIGLSYWVLRTGELASRAGQISPVIAAWLPTIILALAACFLTLRRRRNPL